MPDNSVQIEIIARDLASAAFAQLRQQMQQTAALGQSLSPQMSAIFDRALAPKDTSAAESAAKAAGERMAAAAAQGIKSAESFIAKAQQDYFKNQMAGMAQSVESSMSGAASSMSSAMGSLGQGLLQGVGLAGGLGLAGIGARLGSLFTDGFWGNVQETDWTRRMAILMGGMDKATAAWGQGEALQFRSQFSEEAIAGAIAQLEKFGQSGKFQFQQILDAAAATGTPIEELSTALGRLGAGQMRALQQVSTSLGMTRQDFAAFGVQVDADTGAIKDGYADIDKVLAAVVAKMDRFAGAAQASLSPTAALKKEIQELYEWWTKPGTSGLGKMADDYRRLLAAERQKREEGEAKTAEEAAVRAVEDKYLGKEEQGPGLLKSGLRLKPEQLSAEGRSAMDKEVADLHASFAARRAADQANADKKAREADIASAKTEGADAQAQYAKIQEIAASRGMSVQQLAKVSADAKSMKDRDAREASLGLQKGDVYGPTRADKEKLAAEYEKEKDREEQDRLSGFKKQQEFDDKQRLLTGQAMPGEHADAPKAVHFRDLTDETRRNTEETRRNSDAMRQHGPSAKEEAVQRSMEKQEAGKFQGTPLSPIDVEAQRRLQGGGFPGARQGGPAEIGGRAWPTIGGVPVSPEAKAQMDKEAEQKAFGDVESARQRGVLPGQNDRQRQVSAERAAVGKAREEGDRRPERQIVKDFREEQKRIHDTIGGMDPNATKPGTQTLTPQVEGAKGAEEAGKKMGADVKGAVQQGHAAVEKFADAATREIAELKKRTKALEERLNRNAANMQGA